MPISQPTQQAMHPIQSGQAFAIISGENPRYAPEIAGGHHGLVQALAQSGVKHEPTDGNFGDGKVHSPVVLAYGLGRNQAMDLGRRMGQESIVFSNGGQHEFIYTNGPNAGKFHPTMAQPMQVFPSIPEEGLTTRVPGLGHVRFNFDHARLLDVPRKGSAMSEDTQKSEVSVSDFKRKLADVLRGKIEALSKSMEGYATREVATNGDASVGDFKKSQSVLTMDSSPELWIEELAKTATWQAGQALRAAPAPTPAPQHDSASRAAAIEAHFFAGSPGTPAAHHTAPAATPAVQPARLPGFGTPYRKGEVCPTCKSEVCKCMDKTEPTHGSQTQRKKDNFKDRKFLESHGTSEQVKQFDATNQKTSRDKRGTHPMTKDEWESELGKEELLQKPPTSEAQRRFVHAKAKEGVKWAKKWASEDKPGKLPETAKKNEGPVPVNTCPSCGGKAKGWGMECPSCASKPKKPAKKNEDMIDLKTANTPPKTTDDAFKGGPRNHNGGANETPNVAPATKPVKGGCDEGSGGQVTKGKGLKKDDTAVAPAPVPGAVPASPMVKANKPPMAKPPTANPTPSGVPQSKPKLPKIKMPKMGMTKAALPMGTRSAGGAADAAAHAMRQGQPGAAAGGGAMPGGVAPATPKAMPKPPGAYDANAFKPTGPVHSGLELDTAPKPGGFGAVGPKPAAPGALPKPKLPGKP